MARARTGLGHALSDKPDYSAALAKYEEAAELTSSIGARGDHAAALLNMSRMQINLNRTDDAEKSLNETIAVAKEIGDVSTEGKGYLNLANIAQVEGDTQRAQDLMKQALQIFESANDQDGIGRAYGNMASYQLEAGDLRTALVSANHCVDVRTRIEYTAGIAYCELTRGDILMAQGDLEQSRTAYETAEKLYQQSQRGGRLGSSLDIVGSPRARSRLAGSTRSPQLTKPGRSSRKRMTATWKLLRLRFCWKAWLPKGKKMRQVESFEN